MRIFFQNTGFIKTSGFFVLILLFSCGPRSGIHRDEQNEDKFYATQNESPSLNLDYSTDGGKLFKLNCAVCHSAFTDEHLTGPGLKGIRDRLPQPSEAWFIKYTLNNEKVSASGDPYAAKLKAGHKNAPMTVFEDILTEQDARAIYNFLTQPMADQAVP